MAKQVIDDSHKYTVVSSLGDRGPGGAFKAYIVNVKPEHFTEQEKKDGINEKSLGIIYFQTGPIKEAGVNGYMDENLLAIVIDRLEGFQSGKYACEENAQALEAIRTGLAFLQDRTKRREEAGVEGTHEVAAGDAGAVGGVTE